MKIIKTSSWEECKKTISGLQGSGNHIWRGQSDSRWKLSSSLYRYFENNKTPVNKRSIFESISVVTFKNHFHYKKYFEGLSDDNLLRRVALQHYGCPTRLLDWTWSPYIAAYFSMSDCMNTAAIYCIKLHEYQSYVSKLFQFDDYYGEILRTIPDRHLNMLLENKNIPPIPFWPEYYMEREYLQQSIFILDLKLDTPTEDQMSSIPNELVYKIELPSTNKLETMLDLKAMNITADHLFSEKEGLVLEAKNALSGIYGIRVEI
jgi:hypothetical protein